MDCKNNIFCWMSCFSNCFLHLILKKIEIKLCSSQTNNNDLEKQFVLKESDNP